MEKNITICALPFTHISTHPNGLVTPCCIANYDNGISFSRTKGKLLTLGQDSVEDIMNSQSFVELRKKMLNGEKPIECIGCYKVEESGLRSKRIEENYKYLHKVKLNDKLPNIQLKFIELRLGNVCNVKCLTCNPMSSSKWVEDVKKFSEVIDKDHYNYEEFKSSWYKDKEWYDDLLTHCDELEEIYINGGEPTLIKEHFYFLEKLVEMGKSKDVCLIYNINCTNLPDKFLDLLHQFKHVKLQLSIDDLGERNYYIRYPSVWEDVFNNYAKLKKEPFEITITQTISILNVCNVLNFKQFFQGEQIDYNFVTSPSHLHVSNLDNRLRDLALSQIEHLNQHDKDRFIFEMNSKPYDEELYQRSIRFINMMDKIRTLNIENYLKEYEAIKHN